jgi:hypothetical protein
VTVRRGASAFVVARLRTKAFAVMSDNWGGDSYAEREGASLGMGDNKLTAGCSAVAINTGGSEEWQGRGGTIVRYFSGFGRRMLL